MVNFTVLFPGTYNILVTKEVCMIPYVLNRDHGVNARVATFLNDEFPHLKTETSGLKLDFISKRVFKDTFMDKLIIIKYLISNSKKINILELIHINGWNFIYGLIFKTFNMNGTLYLKMDICPVRGLGNGFDMGSKLSRNIYLYLFSKILNLISVETKQAFNNGFNNWVKSARNKLFYLPSGIDNVRLNEFYKDNCKEKIILTVGRLGTDQKATEVLLNAFAKSALPTDWKLVLIGTIEPEFYSEIDKFFCKYPLLKNRVTFTGPIYEKEALYDYFNRAFIFCLTSRYGSFELVLTEAAFFNCVIVSTKVGVAMDLLNGGKFGKLNEIDDVEGISESLNQVVNEETYWFEKASEMREYCINNFNWLNVGKMLMNKLN